MKINLDGLTRENLPSGTVRHRVRAKGNASKKTVIHLDRSHPNFMEHYNLARLGLALPIIEKIGDSTSLQGSFGWLCDQYYTYLEKRTNAGVGSITTLKKKKTQFKFLKKKYADFPMTMPSSLVQAIHDEKAGTPSAADDIIETIKTMYAWSKVRKFTQLNPAIGVQRYNINLGGAVSWSLDDVKKFKQSYKIGTVEYCALSLLLFSACRIGDARILGRKYEIKKNGRNWLSWIPGKKGSIRVEIPMAPQLIEATRALTVLGPSYLMTTQGKMFSSGDSMSAWFVRICQNAGLQDRSAHGLRKAAGAILAEMGCSNYEIMALHGHTNAKTSEVYTKGANRSTLAEQAVNKLSLLKW